ncbi:MAG: hypothetical protein HY786_02675 [Deltaproteobacteria bacterium]|nr:hypothetical protein [Deltaproteobacteria bacterium]
MTVAWILDVAVVIIDDGVAVKDMLLAGIAPVPVVGIVPVPSGNPLSDAPQAENNIKNAVSIINLRLIIIAGCIFIILSS